jgi:hypothetical protein
VPLLLVLVLLSTACTQSTSSAIDATGARHKAARLGSVSDLQEQFNRDTGKIRLILFVSPT